MLDKYGPFFAKAVYYMSVVYDFMADVYWRTEAGQGELDDFDGPVHSGTKTSGAGQ